MRYVSRWRTGEVVLLPIPALNYCLHPVFIRYSILQFITIRRFLVSNLVSNGWGGQCHGGILGYCTQP